MTQQMTQFSMLEQLTNLATSSEATNVSLARTAGARRCSARPSPTSTPTRP